jgi:hypothetical protein
MYCPEAACIKAEEELRNQVREGSAVCVIHVPKVHHVDSALVEGVIDLALKQRGVHLTYLNVCAGLCDRVGLKIARLLSTSETIEECTLACNNFTWVTVLAVAHALKINKSLRNLTIFDVQTCMGSTLIRDAFRRALFINPNRPPGYWSFSPMMSQNMLTLLKKQGYTDHPTLQELLLGHLHRQVVPVRHL